MSFAHTTTSWRRICSVNFSTTCVSLMISIIKNQNWKVEFDLKLFSVITSFSDNNSFPTCVRIRGTISFTSKSAVYNSSQHWIWYLALCPTWNDMLINTNIYIIILLIGNMKTSWKVPISGSEIKASRTSTHTAKHRQLTSSPYCKGFWAYRKRNIGRGNRKFIVKAVSLPWPKRHFCTMLQTTEIAEEASTKVQLHGII